MVLEFIKRRFQSTYDWQNGNCYWFAYILCDRFPELKMYYLAIRGHFVAGDGEHFYDSLGEYIIPKDDALYELSWIKENEPVWYKNIMEGCRE